MVATGVVFVQKQIYLQAVQELENEVWIARKKIWGTRIRKRKKKLHLHLFFFFTWELLVPVGVLISRLCNQRQLFFPPCWKLSRARSLHHISHPTTPTQPPLTLTLSPASSFYSAPFIVTFFAARIPSLNPRVDRFVTCSLAVTDTG